MLSCIFEDGGTGHMRHTVVDTIVLRDGKILLIKRAAHLLEAGKWGLIGGYIDLNETVREAAMREAFEETGWRIDNLQLLRIIDRPDRRGEDRQNISFVFFAEALRLEGEKDDEVEELRWFDLDALPDPDTIAFDHHESIETYRTYLRKPGPLPTLFT